MNNNKSIVEDTLRITEEHLNGKKSLVVVIRNGDDLPVGMILFIPTSVVVPKIIEMHSLVSMVELSLDVYHLILSRRHVHV